MALIKCPSCGKEINDNCSYCPYCGSPLKSEFVSNESKSFVIGYRGGPGAIKGLAIALLIVGIVFSIIAIVLIIDYFMNLEATGPFFPILVGIFFFIALGMLALVAGFLTVYRMNLNKKLTDNCIVYNANTKKIVLCTIKNEKISIDITDYIELRDNAFTDNLLYFTYKTPEGKFKKVNLGYCSNREDLRPILNRLRNKKYGL